MDEALTVEELMTELAKCNQKAKVYDSNGYPIISAHDGDPALREDAGKVYVEASF